MLNSLSSNQIWFYSVLPMPTLSLGVEKRQKEDCEGLAMLAVPALECLARSLLQKTDIIFLCLRILRTELLLCLLLIMELIKNQDSFFSFFRKPHLPFSYSAGFLKLGGEACWKKD